MAIVVFVPADFKLIYPEFGAVPDARCTAMFGLAAGSLLDNTDNSPVMAGDVRTNLFYLLVAHLLTLFGTGVAGANDDAGSSPVGRLSTATEGSVTSSFEYDVPQGSAIAPWFLQTAYGALYWTAIAPYRSARYIANGASGIGFSQAYGYPGWRIPGGV